MRLKKILLLYVIIILVAGIFLSGCAEEPVTSDQNQFTTNRLALQDETVELEQINEETPFTVGITVDGQRREILTTSAAVDLVLLRAGVLLGPGDKVAPEGDSIVQPGMEVMVTRIATEVFWEDRSLPYVTVERKDPQMEIAIRRTVQKGRPGQERVLVQVTKENEQETDRKVVLRETVRQPVNQIVAVGELKTVSREGHTFRIKKAMEVTATAYAGHGTTYTGTTTNRGTVAVDPRTIPLGTSLYVDGYGFGRALDIGSAIKGNRIDIFLESNEAALNWGRRKVKVYILE